MANSAGNASEDEVPASSHRSEQRQADANSGSSRLTHRQVLALPIIAAAPNMTQAAREAGISESTLRRWRQNEHFCVELNRLTAETADLTRQLLESLTRQSSRVLSDLMQDPDPMVRLRAARAVVNVGIQVTNADTLRKNIEAEPHTISGT